VRGGVLRMNEYDYVESCMNYEVVGVKDNMVES